MKTLNAVITELESLTNCDDTGVSYIEDDIVDEALRHLKEYRSDMKQWRTEKKRYQDFVDSYTEARDKHQQAVVELLKNPPLSWDELRQMAGKPVWVEWDGQPQRSSWIIVGTFHSLLASDDYDRFVYLHGVKGCEACKDNYGSYWQAYRKERE